MPVITDPRAGSDRQDHPRSDEDLADLLADPHCRYLLDCLRREDDSVSVSTLARHVVAGVTNASPTEVPEEVQRRVATWLHHGQLPALEAHGVVDFDADESEVRLAADPSGRGPIATRDA